MIPVDKVREIISRHKLLEKELSSDKVDKKKFAKISKEYSNLNAAWNTVRMRINNSWNIEICYLSMKWKGDH